MRKLLLIMISCFIAVLVNIGFINAAIDNPIFFTRDNGLYSISQEGKEALIYDGNVHVFKISPDKTKIAISCWNKLYIYYLRGKTLKLISKDYAEGDRFNWTKNSKSIIYLKNMDKMIRKEIYMYDIDRDTYSSLGEGSQYDICFEMSPDENKLMGIYCQHGAPISNSLYIRDIVHGTSKSIEYGIYCGVFEAFFINNEEIVYLLDKSYPIDEKNENISKRNIYHMNLTNNKKTLITVGKDILKEFGGYKADIYEKRGLKISPDGRYFSYLFNNMVNIYDRRKRKLFLLSSKLPDITGYSWGVDSKTICCIDKDKIYIVTLDGNVTKVLNIPNGGFRVEW